MKKLKLKALELGANEVLSRSQLKNILGGSGGSAGSGPGSGLGWGNNYCEATAVCGATSITCSGKGYCRGKDFEFVECFDGFGNGKKTNC